MSVVIYINVINLLHLRNNCLTSVCAGRTRSDNWDKALHMSYSLPDATPSMSKLIIQPFEASPILHFTKGNGLDQPTGLVTTR